MNTDCGVLPPRRWTRMKKQVKISVIMGVYNPKEISRLQKAVDSVILQTFGEWELILCNDGSERKYRTVLEEIAASDERIVLIHNDKNHGLGYALNRCLEAAKGSYIARMDDDDISVPDRLRREYIFLENHPEYQWVGSNAELYDENGIWGTECMPKIPWERDFLKYSPYIHPSVMFRREVLQEAGGYSQEESVRRCEDYELFMRLHAQGARGYNLQESLLLYREDADSYLRRTMKSRIQETKLRYRGFQSLGILSAGTIPCLLRPVAAGLIGAKAIWYLKQYAGRGYHGKNRRRQSEAI